MILEIYKRRDDFSIIHKSRGSASVAYKEDNVWPLFRRTIQYQIGERAIDIGLSDRDHLVDKPCRSPDVFFIRGHKLFRVPFKLILEFDDIETVALVQFLQTLFQAA